nr:MAG TPA: baseplate wedge protein [Caudoviricetes sp.]
MMETYITIQGETWDQIALKVYGSEKYAGWIMQNNYPLLDILIFSSGTEINVPELPEMVDDNLPVWKTAESNTDPYSIGEV